MSVIDLDLREFKRLLEDAKKARPSVEQDVWDELGKTTMDTINAVKRMMPVDTGRARASWGEWTATDLVKPNPDAKEEDAIEEMHRAMLETVQGTNVPYVEALNEGHSIQAPAGFLDMAQDWAEQDLEKRLKGIGLV